MRLNEKRNRNVEIRIQIRRKEGKYGKKII